MKAKAETRGTARCEDCIFGRAVTIADKDKRGKVTATRQMCECHVARPTRFGFPVVQLDDFCGCHVSAATAERTFAGMVMTATIVNA